MHTKTAQNEMMIMPKDLVISPMLKIMPAAVWPFSFLFSCVGCCGSVNPFIFVIPDVFLRFFADCAALCFAAIFFYHPISYAVFWVSFCQISTTFPLFMRMTVFAISAIFVLWVTMMTVKFNSFCSLEM